MIFSSGGQWLMSISCFSSSRSFSMSKINNRLAQSNLGETRLRKIGMATFIADHSLLGKCRSRIVPDEKEKMEMEKAVRWEGLFRKAEYKKTNKSRKLY